MTGAEADEPQEPVEVGGATASDISGLIAACGLAALVPDAANWAAQEPEGGSEGPASARAGGQPVPAPALAPAAGKLHGGRRPDIDSLIQDLDLSLNSA